MIIWIDGDACPRPLKEIVFKRSLKQGCQTIVVANSFQQLPRSPHIKMVVVNKDLDAADHYIVEHADPGFDFVITNDVPLASELIAQNVLTINHRGIEFNESNIGEKKAMRDLMTDLRGAGMVSGGPKSFNEQDKQKFAGAFDRILHRLWQKSKLAGKV